MKTILLAIIIALAPVTVSAGELHRFYSDEYKGHFYTASEAEKNSIIANNAEQWQYEGPAYMVDTPGDDIPVYRHWSDQYKGHFYTTSKPESDQVEQDPNWTYEGIAFNVRSHGDPVYRFWSDAYKHHFYTNSSAEKDSIIANDPAWNYEGIAWYASSEPVSYTPPNTPPTTTPSPQPDPQPNCDIKPVFNYYDDLNENDTYDNGELFVTATGFNTANSWSYVEYINNGYGVIEHPQSTALDDGDYYVKIFDVDYFNSYHGNQNLTGNQKRLHINAEFDIIGGCVTYPDGQDIKVFPHLM